jgi:hypothetical protein
MKCFTRIGFAGRCFLEIEEPALRPLEENTSSGPDFARSVNLNTSLMK